MATSKKTTQNTSATLKSADVTLLKHPRITEKAANMGKYNTYLFDVAVGATKNEIAKAFFAVYKQKPLKVNTVNQKAKVYFRRGMLGFGKASKKAYVILPKGTTIEIM
jgi:large subunit ribosomal protein L23